MMDEKTKKIVRLHLYLNPENRLDKPANVFPDEILIQLKRIFFEIYKKEVFARGQTLIVGEKETTVLKTVFDWCICSKEFYGDHQKGIYLVSRQGFGKDIILRTIVEFYKYFGLNFREYTNTQFCKEWFELNQYHFTSPLKINDIKEDGQFKRERTSIPFLELLDYREQINLRRGLIVSSNFLPEALQEELENGKIQKRLLERIKECFNIIHIKDAITKRKEFKKVV